MSLESQNNNLLEEKSELRKLLDVQAEDRQVVEEEKKLLEEKLQQVGGFGERIQILNGWIGSVTYDNRFFSSSLVSLFRGMGSSAVKLWTHDPKVVSPLFI